MNPKCPTCNQEMTLIDQQQVGEHGTIKVWECPDCKLRAFDMPDELLQAAIDYGLVRLVPPGDDQDGGNDHDQP